MEERKAVHYGKVELIPGIICDGYVLDDGTACLSERGTAKLFDMDHAPLKRMVLRWPPKVLKPFVDKGESMVPTLVKVTAKNSPYVGRNIVVYDSKLIEIIISAYVVASGNNALQKNQFHIGKRCAVLLVALVRTALYTAIQQACGLTPNIQQSVQEQCIILMKRYGLKTSFPEEALYTKKDIINFLEKPLSTVNSYIRKHNISHEKIDYQTIKANGGKANRMNGYDLESVSKIVLGMDSVVGIELKKQIFGNVGTLIKSDTKGEIEWQQVLEQVFEGFSFHHNYTFGSYRVDFFIQDLNLILECNGYDNHRNYNQQEELQREKLLNQNYTIIRFHHQITPEQLFNGILKTKIGKTIKIYDIKPVYPKTLNL